MEELLKPSAVCGAPAFLGMLRKAVVYVPTLPWQVWLFWRSAQFNFLSAVP